VETQYSLGENVLQAADGGSSAAIAFIEELARTDEEWPESFVDGLVSECFVNDKNEVRFKTKRVREALMALRLVKQASISTVIDRLAGRIAAGALQLGWGVANKRAMMLTIIGEVMQVGDGRLGDLQRLAEAIAALEVPLDDE
jgi:hypothetical protein